MLTTIIVFILVLGLLIFVHEAGHFVMAKRAGVKVEEFGFGYPPRIFGIKYGETIYSLNLLPIGGFVKICGENGPESAKAVAGKPEEKAKLKDEKRAFYNQPIGKRAQILAAGVLMNLLLAAILLSVGFWLGLPAVVEDEEAQGLIDVRVQISQIALGSPAEEAKIRVGDSIVSLSQTESPDDKLIVTKTKDVQSFIAQHKGEEIVVTIERGKETLEKQVIPRTEHPEDEGPLGIGLVKTAIVSYPWYEAIWRGTVSTFELIGVIVVGLGGLLWHLISTGRLAAGIAGPVGIFSLTGQAAQLGFIYVLQFTALISINLAILNILPFPALDGGRLLFLGIEKIKGSPVSPKVERIVHTAGFALLILLMIAITWRDIVRFF